MQSQGGECAPIAIQGNELRSEIQSQGSNLGYQMQALELRLHELERVG